MEKPSSLPHNMPATLPERMTSEFTEIVFARAQEIARPPAPFRTPGPLEVLSAFAKYGGIKQAASELYISPSTMKLHLQQTYEHLGVTDQRTKGPRAVYTACLHGLIDTSPVDSGQSPPDLSPVARERFYLASLGFSREEIGAGTGVSPGVINQYLSKASHALGALSLPNAVFRAFQRRLFTPQPTSE